MFPKLVNEKLFSIIHWLNILTTLPMFTGVYRVIRVFSAICAGKTCNICRDFLAICKYYRVFPADIAEKPLNHPINPCKHLQCMVGIKIYFYWYEALLYEFITTLMKKIAGSKFPWKPPCNLKRNSLMSFQQIHWWICQFIDEFVA